MDTSGISSSSSGGVGLTTSEMMDPYFLSLNGLGGDPNWVLDAGRDYPRLAWEGTTGQIIEEPEIDWLFGEGTDEAPYEIGQTSQLILLGKASILWGSHFRLTADIDLDPNLPGNRAFNHAVIQSFSGVFDGDSHSISNLQIVGTYYLGIFGYLESGAEIKDVRLQDVHIVGTGSYIGGLVGYNNGVVSNSCCKGSISGENSIGVLVGFNDGTVTTCYSRGDVRGNYNVGGLIGCNDDVVENSYSMSSAIGISYTGGLVGENNDTIRKCYSIGMVKYYYAAGGLVGLNWPSDSEVENSFWDTASSGKTTSAGGIGLPTAQMQDINTFLDAGWDFVDETVNGTDDIWYMPEGDYPRLQWER